MAANSPSWQAVIEHMNADHADALLAYAQHYGQRPQAQQATLINMDLEHLELLVDGEKLRIHLIAPLASLSDARPVLVKMAIEARSALNEQHVEKHVQQ
ncbi:DUF2470 domain-containing protein [Balneatrix alpica]|uniref:DUF2470 domain-containing protein n=1 Tax=Balneatrix alpica TaxID=75684 RepID=A0ABV5ZCQ7_9GAMM|nr:DUF2470 domain-containing protein [Balneatrix alpica]